MRMMSAFSGLRTAYYALRQQWLLIRPWSDLPFQPEWHGASIAIVGNAGYLGALSPISHVTDDAWQNVMSVNLGANWRLIRTLDPLLQKAETGRAIFVTSRAAHGRGSTA